MNDIHKLRPRLEQITQQAYQLEQELADPTVIEDMDHYRKLSKAFADSDAIVKTWKAYQKIEQRIDDAERLASEVSQDDLEMSTMIQEEQQAAEQEKELLINTLQTLLLPKDQDDQYHVILEIRAGTGGDESCLFAADLFRMYCRYVERRRWKLEILSSSEAELGGYKEIICRIEGTQVYGRLKFESGGHRVQRVPDTEAQGRIHTSACTVAVLPEIPEQDIEINPAELRIDTFRASGAGGQHVNKTDSAVRITHKPTGLVVECQDDRSQHRNRARAMSVLAARLHEKQREMQQKKTAATRKLLIGSGDRSERIRTYNFPQGRITDHRIGLTLYKLAMMMDGDLDDLLDSIHMHHQANILAENIPENP